MQQQPINSQFNFINLSRGSGKRQLHMEGRRKSEEKLLSGHTIATVNASVFGTKLDTDGNYKEQAALIFCICHSNATYRGHHLHVESGQEWPRNPWRNLLSRVHKKEHDKEMEFWFTAEMPYFIDSILCDVSLLLYV